MQLTLGAEENISDETIPEILERLRREYTSEADAKLELERAEHAKTKEQREAAEGAWRRLMDEKHRQSSRINQLSQAAGRIAKYFVFALFFLAIVIFSIFAGESQRARAYLPAVLSVPLLIIALSYIGHLLVIAHEASGFSVKRLAERAVITFNYALVLGSSHFCSQPPNLAISSSWGCSIRPVAKKTRPRQRRTRVPLGRGEFAVPAEPRLSLGENGRCLR